MTINDAMTRLRITKYRLSKSSGIPYTTVNDICSGKARLEKCTAETIYKLSKELGISMEDLLEPCFIKRCSFELYKSNVCHQVKESGDIDFIIETLERDDIRKYYQRKWYSECLYLLAMLDYLSNLNHVALCNKYDDLRKCKLKEIIYPSSIRMVAEMTNDDAVKAQAIRESLPEFMRFNIVESEVRNIV